MSITDNALLGELAKHSDWTQKLIGALHDLFPPQELMLILTDPGKKKVAEVYSTLYRRLLQRGYTYYTLHALVRARLIIVPVVGMLPAQDESQLEGVRVVFIKDVSLTPSGQTSNPQAQQPSIKTGTVGRIAFNLIPWKVSGIGLGDAPFWPVEIALEDGGTMHVWVRWSNIEPDPNFV